MDRVFTGVRLKRDEEELAVPLDANDSDEELYVPRIVEDRDIFLLLEPEPEPEPKAIKISPPRMVTSSTQTENDSPPQSCDCTENVIRYTNRLNLSFIILYFIKSWGFVSGSNCLDRLDYPDQSSHL